MRGPAVSLPKDCLRLAAAVAVLACTSLSAAGQVPPAGECERLVAALAGRGGAVTSPEAQGLAHAVPELPVCGAVVSDSKAPCAALGSDAGACENRWFVFHDLRANPKGRGFAFPEFQNCAKDPNLAKYCAGLRAAAVSGDPDKCPKGPVEATCRAAISLDPAACDKLGSDNAGDGIDRVRGCKDRIRQMQPMTKGLKELADSGPEDDRPLARAALGQKDACAAYEKQAMDICGKGIPTVPPTPAPTPPPTMPVLSPAVTPVSKGPIGPPPTLVRTPAAAPG